MNYKNYKKTVLSSDLTVDEVVSVHYFEYTVDFSFSGELHDFWELVYADRNHLLITADTKTITLPQGYLFLHKPMEFHSIRSNGVKAPNSVVIGFSSSCPELYEIAGKMIHCNESEKAFLAGIIEETGNAFSTPLDNPDTIELIRRNDVLFGSEQMLSINLEALLISLIRRTRSCGEVSVAENENAQRKKDEVRLRQICDYFLENVEKDLSSSDVQKRFYISESSLQKLFQNKVGCGAMQHFQRMKIDRAKEMIREKKYNFSEISDRLSFSSIHYFSRRFKMITGMTPSEYASSVKSISGTKK